VVETTCTVESCFTTTPLIQPPGYYGHFIMAQTKVFLYYCKPVNTTRFCRLLVTGLTGFHCTLDDYMYMYTGVSERLPCCLSFFLSVCLSVCLSVYLYLSVCLLINNHSVCMLLTVYLSVCQSFSLSVHLTVYLPCSLAIKLSVCQSVSLSPCQLVSLSVFQSVCQLVCLSISPSVG